MQRSFLFISLCLAFGTLKAESVQIDFAKRSKIILPTQDSFDEVAIRSIFPRHLADMNACDPNLQGEPIDSDRLRRERDAGQDVPSVVGRLKGSFTGPGADEIVYLVSTGECFTTTVTGNWGSYVLAVFRSGVLVGQWDPSANGMSAVVNTKHDGVDELVLEARSMLSRRRTIVARVVSLRGAKFREVRDLGTVYEARCVGDLGRVRAASISIGSEGQRIEWTDLSCDSSLR